MKILFHDNTLCLRGTTVAIYDYAYYCKYMYNMDCSIIYNENNKLNDSTVIDKFKKEFNIVKSYKNEYERLQLLEEINPDYFFVIKAGEFDNIYSPSPSCKNLVMAVSANISKNNVHGDKYFVCSKWLQKHTGFDYVPHMINLPDVEGDMRDELNIPKNATVFARNGGYDTFDLSFVKDAIKKSLILRDDIYFIFQNTEPFYHHERIIYIDGNSDMINKVRFINTSNAHLHAREVGESFGLTCGEFSVKNKPVITWFGSRERNHIDTLGEKGIYYNDYNDILKILLNFKSENKTDWNCYNEYNPESVMSIFKEKYLQ